MHTHTINTLEHTTAENLYSRTGWANANAITDYSRARWLLQIDWVPAMLHQNGNTHTHNGHHHHHRAQAVNSRLSKQAMEKGRGSNGKWEYSSETPNVLILLHTLFFLTGTHKTHWCWKGLIQRLLYSGIIRTKKRRSEENEVQKDSLYFKVKLNLCT